jgi:hypothetical protein
VAHRRQQPGHDAAGWSSDVRPRFEVYDLKYLLATNMELPRSRALIHMCGNQSPDFSYYSLSYFRLRMSLSAPASISFNHIARIVFCGARLNVIRVAARRIVASMTAHHSFGHRTTIG